MSGKYSVWKDETGLHIVIGFEEAMIDIGTQGFGVEVAVYDWKKCVDILMQREGMSREKANEVVSDCATRIYDEQTPVFVNHDELTQIFGGGEEDQS